MNTGSWTKLLLNSGLFLLLSLMLTAVAFAQTPPATYYVATTGSDSNNGTSSTTPFASITHALTLCTGGQTIAVASGTYSTLTYTGTLGGIPTGAVVYDGKVRTSMVTVFGWGATPPLIQPPSTAAYMAVWINGASYVTFNNLVMHSNNAYPLFNITANWATRSPHANFITIQNCDLSDPDSAHPMNETYCIGLRDGGDNITIQNCYIHDSSAGIGGDGPGGGAAAANNVKILNNTLHGFSSDAIQFPDWNNVLIDGNILENAYEVAGDTLHNDGIQFAGPAHNVTVSNNIIRHIGTGQGMIIQEDWGTIDNVLVENNLIYDNGDAAIQNGATHAVYLHNTSPSPLWLRAHYSGGAAITDTVIANNNFYGTGIGYFNGCTAAYEDYNYTLTGYGHGTGVHDILGADPTVNSAGGDYHPAPGSSLFAHAAHSFSATVDGTLTNFTAPTTDLDDITRGNPPTMGAYETTAGNSSIAYSGFDYSTTGAASGKTDGVADYGWVESTWSNGTIVSPGLTYSTLPVLGDALSYNSNPSQRTISPSVMPSGYTVVGTDGITRLGKAGTTVWMSFLIEPTIAQTGSLTSYVRLLGQGTGGSDKLHIGDVTGTTTSWGIGNGYSGTYAYATGAAPITTGQTAFLVVEIQFTTGNSIINLWVNPPMGATPPATPSATLSTVGVGPFNVVQFQGSRTSTGDEFNVGTSWLSVTSGGL